MSNVKAVEITGTIPFSISQDKAIQPHLAFIAGPSCDLNLAYDFKGWYKPNDKGGRTFMYRFHLTGSEALSFSWFELFMERIKANGGTIEEENIIDIEE